MEGGREAEVPLVDGLPATYNQSIQVQMSVAGTQEEAAAYRIDVQSTLAPQPWSVTSTYEDVRTLPTLRFVAAARRVPNRLPPAGCSRSLRCCARAWYRTSA